MEVREKSETAVDMPVEVGAVVEVRLLEQEGELLRETEAAGGSSIEDKRAGKGASLALL